METTHTIGTPTSAPHARPLFFPNFFAVAHLEPHELRGSLYYMGKLRKVFELSFVFERLGCYHARLKFSITLSHKIFNHRFNHRMVIETSPAGPGGKL